MTRRVTLIALVAVLASGSLPVDTASAHTLRSRVALQALSQEYVMPVVAATDYSAAHLSCRAVFRGHSHFVMCSVRYDFPTTPNACTETIEVYYRPHNTDDEDPSKIYARHYPPPKRGSVHTCSPRVLLAPHRL